MEFVTTALPEVIKIVPRVFSDERGFFMETWQAKKFTELGIDATFVQDNHSRSSRGTLRGLHAQLHKPQGKLLRASVGEIFDVAVDIRQGSPTFGKHVGVHLSAENFRQLYVPPGILHGFLVTSEFAQFEYKCTDVYNPATEFCVAWNDPDIGIEWPITSPILSEKDRCAPQLKDVEDKLIDYEP